MLHLNANRSLQKREPLVDWHVNLVSGVAANRLAVKIRNSGDNDVNSKVSPRDVTDHVMASARRERPDVQLCLPQPVDIAWSLLANYGYYV